MRLRRDTIRVEESAICIGRLSLHRLPAKRRRGLCAVGFVAAQDLVEFVVTLNGATLRLFVNVPVE
jgi:hypothetical protein